MKTISVIIPSFNKGKLVLRTLQSVYRSTGIDASYSLEVLIIDDHSTDPETLESYLEISKSHPKARLITNPDKGVGAARNYGLKESTGEYVVFLDNDDLLSPSFIQESLIFLENKKADFVYPNILKFGKYFGYIEPPNQATKTLYRYNYIPVTCLYKKDILEKVGGFRTNLKGMEDWDLIIRLTQKGFIGLKHPEPDKVLLLYRMNNFAGVNSSVSSFPAKWKIRKEIICSNNVNDKQTWIWNMIAAIYGLLQPLTIKKEQMAYENLDLKFKKKIQQWTV